MDTTSNKESDVQMPYNPPIFNQTSTESDQVPATLELIPLDIELLWLNTDLTHHLTEYAPKNSTKLFSRDHPDHV